MLTKYKGFVRGNVVELPADVELSEGSEVTIVVGDIDESLENYWWIKLSEASFARDWDNELDAVYDNWREIYGVKE